ncbi:MAG: hypothetical protein KC535_05395 [Nanoarchaeota archaeon]|nr:hypothetical protein [Nanoarchaeota archaeon]
MSKKYLKRTCPFLDCGEALLKVNRLIIFLLLVLSFVSLASAELPDASQIGVDGLDIGVHFIRPESKYVTPNSGKPHYLNVDAINFIACIDAQSDPRAFVICSDNNNFKEVTLYPWPDQERCFVGGMPLSDFSCTNALVQVEYVQDDENLKVSGEFTISTFSTVLEKLLNSQYNDGGWRSALDTAFGVRALSHFDEIFDFEISQGLQWLKLNRNNDEKCWPKAPCNLEETTKILALLSDTGLNDSFRVINDGRNFLEQRQNYYDLNDEWWVNITDVAIGATISLVAINETVLDENFSIPANGSKILSFEASQGNILRVISDTDVIMNIYNQDGLLRYNFQGDNLTYTIPGACWSLNLPGEPCDSGATVYASSTNLSSFRIDRAKDYMITQIHSGVVKHYYGDGTDPVESALYVKDFYDPDLLDGDNVSASDQDGSYLYDVMQWVLFKQNNEGYWGDEFTGDTEDDEYESQLSIAREDQLKKTAFIVMALLDSGFNRSSEPVVDAHDWVSGIEDEINQSSGGSLGAALFIVQNNAYPLIYASPSVVVVDEQVKEVSFINPTPFEYRDLSFTLSENLQQYLDVEEKDFLSAFNYRTIKFTKKKVTDEELSGFVSVGNADQEIGRIPVLVFDSPTLEITSPDSLTVFGRSSSLKLTATKSKHSFDCSIAWDDASLKSPSFKLTKTSQSVNIEFSQAKTTEDVYTGELTCSSLGHSFEFPLSVQMERYVDKPLTLFPSTLVINGSSSQENILVKNNLDIDLSVSLSTNQYSEELLFPQEIFLPAGSSKNISLKGSFDTTLNYSGSTHLTFSTLDTSDSITLLVDVYSTPGSSGSLLRLIIILLFISALLGAGGYFTYQNRDELLKALNKIPLFQSKVEIQKKKASLVDLRSEEKAKAIMNMYTILKFQQATDAEIKKRLLGTFSKEELEAAFEKEGIALDTLDETEPEKV